MADILPRGAGNSQRTWGGEPVQKFGLEGGTGLGHGLPGMNELSQLLRALDTSKRRH